jgi:hypothetical protein
VSSHGFNEKQALESLADSIKEYILTAVENDAIDKIYDPAHSKYWRIYNDIINKFDLPGDIFVSSQKIRVKLKKSRQKGI